MWRQLIAVVICTAVVVSGEITLSLDSDSLEGPWVLENGNKSVKTKGRVPGGVYSDLYDNGVLNNSVPLFYRTNDLDYRWVSLDNWTYSREFDVSDEILAKTVVNLVLYGVDTIAEVALNGQVLGSLDNMFVRYVFPIKGIVKKSQNLLEVRFTSPVAAANAAADRQPYLVPPKCVPNEYQGECHANLLRKMQASFSWDWGPAFPSVGLWFVKTDWLKLNFLVSRKSVEIEGFDTGVIRDISVKTEKFEESDEPMLRITIGFTADLATERFLGGARARLQIIGAEKESFINLTKSSDGNYSYTFSGNYEGAEKYYHLWWPNGYGPQQLYNVTCYLENFDTGEMSIKSVTTGLRTVELIQEPLRAAEGLSFYFRVNGVPIFAKGSNWIPGHVLPELGSRESAIRHLLLSAKEANMNMLRVWGGGVYESDLFYQIADELGILIWQDMMFACSMYPTDNHYLDSVRVEIDQQIRRLQHHPSIAVWAGNNENEAALRGNWYGTQSNFSLYTEDYIKLYVDVIRKVVGTLDTTRTFVVSSPSNGLESELNEGFVAQDPYSALYGDVHYYNYLSDGWDSFTYPDTRFASEYGFQSMPSFLSLQAVSEPSDLKLKSSFTQLRQHHPNGYIEMIALIRQHFTLNEEENSEDFFKKFIYYSQIYQAMATKTETEKYRRDRSKLTASNKGHTMGALYWQLNDVWEAPTWASIEFNGRWKMLQYFAKKFFSPVLISPEVTPASEINIYVISDLLTDLQNISIQVSAFSFDSFDRKHIMSISNTAIANLSSTLITSLSIPNLVNALEIVNCTTITCFYHFTVSNENETLSENVYFPSSFSKTTLPNSNIQVQVDKVDDNQAILYVTASSVAPFVWLETKVPGVFSDNGFIMTNGSREIVFTTRGEPINKQEFINSLTINDITSDLKKLSISYSVNYVEF